MSVFEMSSKMTNSIELFRCVALTKFVDTSEVINAFLPIRRLVTEFSTTEAAEVCHGVARIGE